MNLRQFYLKLMDWWHKHHKTEKRFIVVGGIALGILLFYIGYWSPFMQYNASLRAHIISDRNTLVWMKSANQALLNQPKKDHSQQKSIHTIAFMNLLQQKIHANHWETHLKSLQQSGENQISIQLDNISFDTFIAMLITLNQDYLFNIIEVSTTALPTPGNVNIATSIMVESIH